MAGYVSSKYLKTAQKIKQLKVFIYTPIYYLHRSPPSPFQTININRQYGYLFHTVHLSKYRYSF